MSKPPTSSPVRVFNVILLVLGLTACQEIDHFKAKMALKCDSYQSIDSLRNKVVQQIRSQTLTKANQNMNNSGQQMNVEVLNKHLQQLKIMVSDVRSDRTLSINQQLACQAKIQIDVPQEMLQGADIARYLSGVSRLDTLAAERLIEQTGTAFSRDEGYHVQMAKNNTSVFSQPFSNSEIIPFMSEIVVYAVQKDNLIQSAEERGQLTKEQANAYRHLSKPEIELFPISSADTYHTRTTLPVSKDEIESLDSTMLKEIEVEPHISAHKSQSKLSAEIPSPQVIVEVFPEAFAKREIMHKTVDGSLNPQQLSLLQQARADLWRSNQQMNILWKATSDNVRQEMRDYQVAWLAQRQSSCFEQAKETSAAQQELTETLCHVKFNVERLPEMRKTIKAFEKIYATQILG